MRYDLVVIGSEPAAYSGAIAAAAMNKRVAVVEHSQLDSGSVRGRKRKVPSRILRDAVLFLTRDRFAAGGSSISISMRDLKRRVQLLVDRDTFAIRDRLDRSGVDLYCGQARFARPQNLVVNTAEGATRLEAGKFLIACGTAPSRPKSVPFDGRRIFDTDEILQLESLPESLIVAGAGAGGMESALLLAHLGVRVTVVDGSDRLFESCDRDVAEMLIAHARSLGMTFHLGEEVLAIEQADADRVALHFAGGERLISDRLLYAAGRVGNTEGLDLAVAGIEPDERGRLWCDEDQRTWAAHVFGAGSVVGFPTLAGTSADQGRRAVHLAFGRPYCGTRQARFQLDAIPAVSTVGRTEQQLSDAQIAYDVARLRAEGVGGVAAEPSAMLKLLFQRETGALLGVQGVGDQAAEAALMGEAVMAASGTIDDFWRKAFASPTMVACCDRALQDGVCRRRVDRPAAGRSLIEPHLGSSDRDGVIAAAAEIAAL